MPLIPKVLIAYLWGAILLPCRARRSNMSRLIRRARWCRDGFRAALVCFEPPNKDGIAEF